MNDLSHEARSLLATARNVAGPPGPRRQRIKRSVLLRVAAVTAASAGASVAGATSLASKLVITSVLATMVTGGAFGVLKWRTSVEAPTARRGERAAARPQGHRKPVSATAPVPPNPDEPGASGPFSPLGLGQPSAPEVKLATRQPSRSSVSSPTVPRARKEAVTVPLLAMPAAVLPTEIPSPRAGTASAPLSPPTAGWHTLPDWPTPISQSRNGTAPQTAYPPSRSARSFRPPPANTPGPLVREVALLRRAHDALRDGKPQIALHVLADYDREFPNGSLREERAAIGAIAACQARPGPQARARAQELLRHAPGTLLADSVRAACQVQERVAK